MPIFKRILLVLLLPLLPLLLFLLALDFAVLRVAGTPEPIKETLKDSGIYTSAIDTFLESTDNPNKDTSGEISPDNPVVQTAFKKAFPPELIETSMENFIDSTYRWLKGETAVPDFRIDLTLAKTTFVEEVAAGAQTRAANLPVCPRGQVEFGDPFSATCLPRGVSPSLAAEKIRTELGGNDNFLSDPVLTANSFKSSENPEKSAFAGSSLPGIYQGIRNGQTVLIVLALLLIAGISLLSPSLRLGFRRVGIVMLVVGLSILITVFITNKVASDTLPNLLAKSENQAITDKLQTLIQDLTRNTNEIFSLFAWIYIFIGIGVIVATLFINRSKKPEVAGDSGQPEEQANPARDPAKPKPKTRSPKQ